MIYLSANIKNIFINNHIYHPMFELFTLLLWKNHGNEVKTECMDQNLEDFISEND